jgi:hypothetical protein
MERLKRALFRDGKREFGLVARRLFKRSHLSWSLLTQGVPLSSECLSGHIFQYGQEPVSIKEEQDTFPALQCWGYKAFRNNNKCPKCKKHALTFSDPTAFFD